jgi:phosphonoacetaldehyde hydrolase
MWTIAITATGNEIGLSQAEWEALPAEERCRRERVAGQRLTAAGAHFVAASLAVCGTILNDIDRRIAAGEKP